MVRIFVNILTVFLLFNIQPGNKASPRIPIIDCNSGLTYFGEYGPENWELFCSKCGGFSQSPIDINSKEAKDVDEKDPPLEIETTYDVPPEMWQIINLEFLYYTPTSWGPRAKWPSLKGGPLKEDKYNFVSFNFRFGCKGSSIGTEHKIDGKSGMLELHFLHLNTKYDNYTHAKGKPDGYAMISVLVKEDNDLEKECKSLKTMSTWVSRTRNDGGMLEVPGSGISLSSLMAPHKHDYYTYVGSFTAPPCANNVIWIVMQEFLSVSTATLEIFRTLKSNDQMNMCGKLRPVQAINKREVQFRRPH